MITELNKIKAIDLYAKRKKTIRQLAKEFGVPYENMRKILVKAGFSNGLKVK